jgi:hypothetical protein
MKALLCIRVLPLLVYDRLSRSRIVVIKKWVSMSHLLFIDATTSVIPELVVDKTISCTECCSSRESLELNVPS